jgi:ABC-type sugar transport system ATPase subunit
MSIIAAPIVDGGIRLNGFTFPAERAFLEMAASDSVLVGIRSEDLVLSADRAEMTVTLVEGLGADTYVYDTFSAYNAANVDLAARNQSIPSPQIRCVVKGNPSRTHIFDSQGAHLRLSSSHARTRLQPLDGPERCQGPGAV